MYPHLNRINAQFFDNLIYSCKYVIFFIFLYIKNSSFIKLKLSINDKLLNFKNFHSGFFKIMSLITL